MLRTWTMFLFFFGCSASFFENSCIDSLYSLQFKLHCITWNDTFIFIFYIRHYWIQCPCTAYQWSRSLFSISGCPSCCHCRAKRKNIYMSKAVDISPVRKYDLGNNFLWWILFLFNWTKCANRKTLQFLVWFFSFYAFPIALLLYWNLDMFEPEFLLGSKFNK